jgi:hypothetical protein
VLRRCTIAYVDDIRLLHHAIRMIARVRSRLLTSVKELVESNHNSIKILLKVLSACKKNQLLSPSTHNPVLNGATAVDFSAVVQRNAFRLCCAVIFSSYSLLIHCQLLLATSMQPP